jgi:hypothetical protein
VRRFPAEIGLERGISSRTHGALPSFGVAASPDVKHQWRDLEGIVEAAVTNPPSGADVGGRRALRNESLEVVHLKRIGKVDDFPRSRRSAPVESKIGPQ